MYNYSGIKISIETKRLKKISNVGITNSRLPKRERVSRQTYMTETIGTLNMYIYGKG